MRRVIRHRLTHKTASKSGSGGASQQPSFMRQPKTLALRMCCCFGVFSEIQGSIKELGCRDDPALFHFRLLNPQLTY